MSGQPGAPVPFAAYGAPSMTAPLRRRPGPASAQRVRARLRRPGPRVPPPGGPGAGPGASTTRSRTSCAASASVVHELGSDAPHPDLIYPFDPLLVTDRGRDPAALRQADPSRGGGRAGSAGLRARGIPTLGRIGAPGTVDGGDTFWLRPDLFCIGRTLRTNDAGARQLAGLVGGDVRVFDVPFWRGPAELLHLLSVISPVADDLAVVYLPLLPVGLWELLGDLGIRLISVPDEEFPTLGCNVLAVRPGVCVVADGNPATRRALEAAGCEVHAYPAHEIGINGSGGPTCLTRPHPPAGMNGGDAAGSPGRDGGSLAPPSVRRRTRSIRRPITADLLALLRDPVADGRRGRRPRPSRATTRRRSASASAPWDADPVGARGGSRRSRAWRCRERRCRSWPGTLRGARPGQAAAPRRPTPTWSRPATAAPGTTPAFAPEVRDGRVFGRGACDMKGGLVAALAAIRAVSRAPSGRPRWPARRSCWASRPRRTAGPARSPRSGPATSATRP